MGKESLDLFSALLKISVRSDAKITEQLPIAGTKPILHLHGRIMVEYLLTPGVSGYHPEYSLSLVAALDQLPASVNRDRVGNIADV